MAYKIVYVDAFRLNVPGGELDVWLREMGAKVQARAELTAPVGVRWGADPHHEPGRLQRSHSHNVIMTPRGLRLSVRNDAFYARWVHNGVAHIIEPIGQKRMPVTDWGRRYYRWTVNVHPSNVAWRGQPWLRNALVREFLPYRR